MSGGRRSEKNGKEDREESKKFPTPFIMCPHGGKGEGDMLKEQTSGNYEA